jgi:integrase
MAIVKDLDQHYVDHHLQCPDGKARIEIVDPQRTGLYIQVRAHRPGEGTYYLRYKDGAGKTCHAQIGRTREMTLQEARIAALRRKSELFQGVSRDSDEKAPPAASAVQRIDVPSPPTATLAIDVGATSDGVMTLDTLWTGHYLPYAKTRKRSWLRDEQIYRRLKPKFGHLPLTGIKRLAVEEFQNSLLVEEKLARSTVNQHAVLLRRMLNLAVQWEKLDRNVLTRFQLFDPENQVDRYLDDAQVDKLVHVLKTDENVLVCMILLFLLSTGARRSEGLKAEWRQIDMEKKTWRIPSTNSKSKKPKTLPLNASAVWVLEQLDSKESSPYVFPSPATGKPFLEITRVWKRLLKKAGLPLETRIHDLRHTFASRLVSSGRSLFDVQKLLGHADPRMSMRYAHLSMEAMQEASNAAALNVS